MFSIHGVDLPEGALSLHQGYHSLLCDGALPASLGGEGLGHACHSDSGEAPFPAQMKGKGACFMGEGIVVRWANGSSFLQLVAIIHFIISMMKKFVRSLPNFYTSTYVLISIMLKTHTHTQKPFSLKIW